jgi:hypothetical protein
MDGKIAKLGKAVDAEILQASSSDAFRMTNMGE